MLSTKIHKKRHLKRCASIWKHFSKGKNHVVNAVRMNWKSDAFTVLMHVDGTDVYGIVKQKISHWLMWMHIDGRHLLCIISTDMT